MDEERVGSQIFERKEILQVQFKASILRKKKEFWFKGKVDGRQTDKVIVAPIELEPTMDTSKMLEYCASIQSQLPKVERILDELLQKQLEVNKDLLTRKMQMEYRQKSWKVAKETLSKLLFRIQKLRGAIEKQKVEWDVVQNNSFNVKDVNVAHLEGAPTRDALRALETKTSELLVALKKFEYEELQTSKKANMQKNVYDAFEERVVKGEVENTLALEKSLTIGKEVQQAIDKFENFKRQQCALGAHNKVIEHGKGGFLLHLKLFFSLRVGLDSNDLHEECSIFSMIITPCAFCGRKFPHVWDC